MDMIPVSELESRSYRAIEILLLAPTALWGLVGLGIIFVGLTEVGGVTGTQAGLVGIFGTIGVAYFGFLALGVVSWVLSPFVLYFDTKQINDADVSWEPNPILYAVGAVFLGYLVKLHHIYKRHQFVVDYVDRDWWWIPVVVGAVLPVVCLGTAIAMQASLGFTPFAVLVGLGILTAVPFPLAIYRDATYVRLHSPEWQPNPGNYLNIAVFLLLLAPIAFPLTGGYYLFRRYRAIGFGGA
jgi:hypothetical protein